MRKTSNVHALGRGLALVAAGLMAALMVWAGGAAGNDPAATAPAIAQPDGRARRRPHPARTPKPLALPADLKIPRYAPGPPPFRTGETLVYDASWVGIPAAEARFTLTRNKAHPEWWTGQMWITSSKPVDLLYRMRDYFREDFLHDSLVPNDIYIFQHEKQRQDVWRVSFDHDAHSVTSVKTNKEGRTWIRRFSGGDPFGPFSGAMIALSQPLRVGQTYTFDVFSGGNRYVFDFAVQGRERITTALGSFDTLRIEPSVVWLSEGDFRSQTRETTLWVTDDKRHLPVRIESAVFIGDVRADLVQAINTPGPALNPPPAKAAAPGEPSQAAANAYPPDD